MRGELDIVYLDFSIVSDTVSHNIFIDKLRKYELDEQMVTWTENWLSSQGQNVAINGTKASWRSVTRSVTQG